MSERVANGGGGLEQAKRECLDRERWRLFCYGHHFGDVSGGISTKDRKIVCNSTNLTRVNISLKKCI